MMPNDWPTRSNDHEREVAARLRRSARAARADVPVSVRASLRASLRSSAHPPEAEVSALPALLMRIAALIAVVVTIWLMAPRTDDHHPGALTADRIVEPRDERGAMARAFDRKVHELGLDAHVGEKTLDGIRGYIVKGDLMLRGLIARVPPSLRERDAAPEEE